MFPLKFWPTKEHYELWINYLQLECSMKDYDSLNCLYLCTKIFEQTALNFFEVQKTRKPRHIPAYVKEESKEISNLPNPSRSTRAPHNKVSYRDLDDSEDDNNSRNK